MIDRAVASQVAERPRHLRRGNPKFDRSPDRGALGATQELTGGAPSLAGKDPAAHMLFVKAERRAVYERTYKFLNVLDYLNLRLTGRFVATVDSILTSWVTDNRDPSKALLLPVVTLWEHLHFLLGAPPPPVERHAIDKITISHYGSIADARR